MHCSSWARAWVRLKLRWVPYLARSSAAVHAQYTFPPFLFLFVFVLHCPGAPLNCVAVAACAALIAQHLCSHRVACIGPPSVFAGADRHSLHSCVCTYAGAISCDSRGALVACAAHQCAKVGAGAPRAPPPRRGLHAADRCHQQRVQRR